MIKFKTTTRYKRLKGKKVPLCDYHGICKNKAYREVYPFFLKKYKIKGWSYLCKKHFEQELKKFKGKLPCCDVD
ncbi:unnamed protein product [marine sediment metagenome]|uniref:Uncharacterized protein n=1 Tax=marine sediment metagenome TaxID=412755 RepID=X0UFV0_9ZZZZ